MNTIALELVGLMKQLSHAWRLFGTGLSFTVFGLAGLIMGLILFPMLFVFIRDAGARQIVARHLISNAFNAFIWMMKNLGVLSYRIQGEENVCSNRNQLIIANHPTLIDVVFLLSMFPQADCVIKVAVKQNLFMRSTVTAAYYISNSEPNELMESCIRSLKSGGSLILFPEGTRSVRGQPLDFQLGAAEVAIGSGVEILPIVIQCTPPTLAKHEPWYKIPPSRPHFSIQVLTPTSFAELVPGDHNPRQARRVLNQSFRALFARKLS